MIIVTGASGFIGSYLIRFLFKLNYPSPIIGTYCTNKVDTYKCTFNPYRLNRTKEFLANLESSDEVYFIHLASTVSFDFNVNYRNDASAIKDLITDLPKKHKDIKFIFISSVAVDALDSDYAVIKEYNEKLLMNAASSSFKVVILRAPYVNKSNVIRVVKDGIRASTENLFKECTVIKLEA